ncbi:MAG: four helix bundle protein [Candidatus Margulisiibacteriota bacterium]
MNELQTSNIQIQNKSKPRVEPQTSNKVYDLRERLLIFAKRILQICKMLPRIPECEGIRRQLADAGTSIGANFEEADGALTKKDFINRVGISRKEAKETRFWLRTISGTFVDEKELSADIRESEEIISILSSMLRKSGAVKRR